MWQGMETVWLLLFVIFIAVEVVTAVSLVSIWFCIGSIFAMFAADAGVSVYAQFMIFIVASLAMLICLKPIFIKFLKKDIQPTNLDRNIGNKAIVIHKIDNMQGAGAIKIDGKVWTAVNVDGDEIIPIDSEVIVEEIKGVKAYVKKI